MSTPQTLEELNAYIAEQVAAAQAEAERALKDQQATAEKYIENQYTEKKSELQSLDQRLANDFIGFRIGGIAPAYSTSNSSVYIRDALGLSSTGESGEKKPMSIFAVLAIAGVVYYVFFNKRRK